MRNSYLFLLLFSASFSISAETCVENDTGLSEPHFAYEFIPAEALKINKAHNKVIVVSPKNFFSEGLADEETVCVKYNDSQRLSKQLGYFAIFIRPLAKDRSAYSGDSHFWLSEEIIGANVNSAQTLSVGLLKTGTIAVTSHLDKEDPKKIRMMKAYPEFIK